MAESVCCGLSLILNLGGMRGGWGCEVCGTRVKLVYLLWMPLRVACLRVIALCVGGTISRSSLRGEILNDLAKFRYFYGNAALLLARRGLSSLSNSRQTGVYVRFSE